MGISYGTHVALQYARAFPEHVDRLILDSIVGPDGPDRLPARHLPQPAARARRAVRPRRLSQRDEGPGGRRGRARAADQRERSAARRLLRRGRPQARHAVLHARRALLPAHRGRPEPVPAGGAAGRHERRAPRRQRAAHAPAAHRPGRPDARGGPVGRPQRRHRLHRRDAALPARGVRARPRGDRPAGAGGDPADRLRPVRSPDRPAHELRRRLPGLARRRDPRAVHRAAARRAGAAARRPPGHAHAARERARHRPGAAALDDRGPQGLGPRRARQRHHRLHGAGAGALHRGRRGRPPVPGPRQRRRARRRCRRTR